MLSKKRSFAPTRHPELISGSALLILLIIVALGTVGYFGFKNAQKSNISPTTPMPPTNQAPKGDLVSWKVFSDSKYSFKYPQSWISNAIPKNSYQVINVGENDNSIILSLSEKLPGLGLEDKTLLTKDKFNLGGMPVIKSTYQDLGSNNKEIWISLKENSGDFLMITYGSEKSLQLIDQILSTFKFTNNQSADSKFNLSVTQPLLKEIPNLNLPLGIENSQLYDPQQVGNEYFVKFLKGNMNLNIHTESERSGVLQAKVGDPNWKILFEIIDLAENRNNPYEFWKEGNKYFSVLVDANGAGSGEGNGKLVSIDTFSKKWELLDCFYYVPERFNEYINKLPLGSILSNAIKDYLDPSFAKYNSDFIYDSAIGQYKINGHIEKGCTSFDIKVY